MKTTNISDKERFAPHAEAMIKGYRELSSIWGAILKVAAEMDGKVFNKRFTDAINAKIEGVGRVSATDPYNMGYKTLHIYLYNRSYQIDGVYGTFYFDDEIWYKDLHNVNDILSDGRIKADKASYHITKIFDLINNKIEIYSDALKNYDKYMQKRAKALEAFGKAMADINPLFEYESLNRYAWREAAEKAK